MTLRRKLALRYAAIVVVCLLLLAGLAHHEFVTEPRLRQKLGIPELAESEWLEFVEVFLYSMIPLVLGCGWWLMRRTLAPINTLAERVESIHAGNLRAPLPPIASGDEVDRLTAVFNAMMARLDQSFLQIREFTLQTSHELKTPLTVMRAHLDTMLREGEDLLPQQREWIYAQLDEVRRLARIVDTLALLTQADAGLVNLELKPVRLDQLVRESYEDAVVLAEAHEVKPTLGACEDLVVMGDRDRLRQLLLNLMDNAVKYNWPGGAVTLALRKSGNTAELEITNTGSGIPPELQPHLFDRFVRGAEARGKAAEGCGLGLTICQWIVHAHKGTIRISSEQGQLTVALVRLPLAASHSDISPGTA